MSIFIGETWDDLNSRRKREEGGWVHFISFTSLDPSSTVCWPIETITEIFGNWSD